MRTRPGHSDLFHTRPGGRCLSGVGEAERLLPGRAGTRSRGQHTGVEAGVEVNLVLGHPGLEVRHRDATPQLVFTTSLYISWMLHHLFLIDNCTMLQAGNLELEFFQLFQALIVTDLSCPSHVFTCFCVVGKFQSSTCNF